MTYRAVSRILKPAVAGFAMALLATGARGATVQVLHNFGGTDGEYPTSALILDPSGNLYGTTFAGALGRGTVFELVRGEGGLWTEKVLADFPSPTPDSAPNGSNPEGSLTFDASGNLYGTTQVGGAPPEVGTVFKLAPAGDGTWTETVLLSFNESDGWNPYSALVFDTHGNLYGTTSVGGSMQGVVVSEIDSTGHETVLIDFGEGESAVQGSQPAGGIIFDPAGNLYGTTDSGARPATEPCSS